MKGLYYHENRNVNLVNLNSCPFMQLTHHEIFESGFRKIPLICKDCKISHNDCILQFSKSHYRVNTDHTVTTSVNTEFFKIGYDLAVKIHLL